MEGTSLNDIFVDIPYISDEVEDRKSPSPSSKNDIVSLWLTENQNNLISATPSPSSSIREDGLLLTRKHTAPFVYVSGHPSKTSSLDDIRRKSDCSCNFSRTGYSRRSNYSEFGGSFRHNSNRNRKNSFRNSSRSRKSSYNFDRRSIKSVSRRTSGSGNMQPAVIQKTEEQIQKEHRHRVAVWLVLGSFIFIAISSILVVIVTLTHQSEYVYNENNTVTYYTFLKPSNFTQVIFLKFWSLKWRKVWNTYKCDQAGQME